MSELQTRFDRNISDTFELSEGEYQGPLKITKSCVIDGGNQSSNICAAVWVSVGPAISVEAEGVTIKNLRVRAIGNAGDKDSQIAIKTLFSDTKLENVEVSGNLCGFSGEADEWKLPNIFPLGKFAAEKVNEFTVQIDAAAEADLSTDISGISLIPAKLLAGRNMIKIVTEKLSDNTLLFGSIFVKTSVIRKICLTGRAEINAPERNEILVSPQSRHPASKQQTVPRTQPAPVGSLPAKNLFPINNIPTQQPRHNNIPTAPKPPKPIPRAQEVSSPTSSLSEDKNITYLNAGQCISLGDIDDRLIRLAYFHSFTKKRLDMDAYVFLLGENGRALNDGSMIFFSKEESDDHSVKVTSSDKLPVVLLDLNKVSPTVEKITIVFSIYGDEPSMNFSLISCPILRIFSASQEYYRFKFGILNLEKTVVAAEIYRYNDEWRLKLVGAGYNRGLRHLCESYGVNVK